LRAAYLNTNNLKFEIQNVEKPKINEGNVLLKVNACGICGTDLHEIKKKSIKTFMILMARRFGLHRPYGRKKLLLGHEICGEIENSEINNQIGKSVVVFPDISCGKCWSCKQGYETTCDSSNNIGSIRDGGFAEYVSIPKKSFSEIPKTLDPSVATLSEPMACAVHAIKRSGVKKGDDVFILGVGTIGLLITYLCSIIGVSNIVVSDLSAYRLKFASEFGATEIYSSESMSRKDTFSPDIAYDCVGGTAQTLNPIIDVIRPRGKICVVGFHSSVKPINIRKLQTKESQIITSQGCDFTDKEEAISVIIKNQYKLQEMITHNYPLEKIAEAFSIALQPERYEAIKIVIRI
jgi:2-desacetyl-2-hydroxyethyl bacteriochlorophyllide A dehydrogenase